MARWRNGLVAAIVEQVHVCAKGDRKRVMVVLNDAVPAAVSMSGEKFR